MGFENCDIGELHEAPRHKRSKSFPDNRGLEEDGLDGFLEPSLRQNSDMKHLEGYVQFKKKHSPTSVVKTSLRREILQLEKRLNDQVVVRLALEKALGYRPLSCDTVNEISIPKPAADLVKEIAVLEVEVMRLEQHLLSLYRKAFNIHQISSVSPTDGEASKSPLTIPREIHLQASRCDATKRETSAVQTSCQLLVNRWKESPNAKGEKFVDSGVQRCHSSLSQQSLLSRDSPPLRSLSKSNRNFHSQPLSTMENGQDSSNLISLADHLGTRISDHLLETPNKLSEDMIKCMSAIYCKLADSSLTSRGLLSPNSSLSSLTVFSPKHLFDMWSPGFRKDLSLDVQLDNPFHVEGLQEFSGPYSTMIEVPCIYRDGQKFSDIEGMLQNFRSLICQLEEVDPRKMKHEEKLSFWINVHNALVMHAFLAYGIPQNNVKRVFLPLKAAYNVGGHIISADTIQSSILGCRMPRPGQWLRLLLYSRTKFKGGDERQAYAIENPEPLLHFALCAGSHSDPAVRVYTPKRVYQELEMAKEEYIRATFGIRRTRKFFYLRLWIPLQRIRACNRLV
ncbi:hypothetical protein NMG60_11026140 [Bertholletia excelsa]